MRDVGHLIATVVMWYALVVVEFFVPGMDERCEIGDACDVEWVDWDSEVFFF